MPIDPNTLATHLMAGRVRDCLLSAEEALGRDEEDILARAYRGIALGLSGEADEGLADLRRAATDAESVNADAIAAFSLHYLGNALNAAGQQNEAYTHLQQAATLGRKDAGLFTALCETARFLGQEGAARAWGAQALDRKDAEAHCPPEDEIERRRPRVFKPGSRRRNIVSYSLFGADAYYRECAVLNARQHRYAFPEFTARFYCGQEIPADLKLALVDAGAEVKVSSAPTSGAYAGLFWRFLPFDDPDVDVVVVRDVDSPVTVRERAAIDLWLTSEEPFYVMRDDVQHTAPMLAGLWGGFTGLLPPLEPMARAYLLGDSTRYSDQNFLRRMVWPRIRGATLAIDSVYSLRDSVDFPKAFTKRGSLHVGCSYPRSMFRR